MLSVSGGTKSGHSKYRMGCVARARIANVALLPEECGRVAVDVLGSRRCYQRAPLIIPAVDDRLTDLIKHV